MASRRADHITTATRWHIWALWFGLAAGTASAAVLAYGLVAGGRRLRVERHVVSVPNLPRSFEGASIALIADIQVGMPLGNPQVAAHAVRLACEHRPLAVLLAGDFILHPRGSGDDRIAEAVDVLRPIASRGIPVFAVLGNHDYDLPSDEPRDEPLQDQVTRALEDIGIRVLRNDYARLSAHGREADTPGLVIVGLGEYRAGDDDATAALRGLGSEVARIVMMHNPDTFPKLPQGTAPLAVAGHTHGGQVSMALGAPSPWWLRLTRVPEDQRRGSGWVDEGFGQPGNRLYITRGIGFSKVPVRINATPELTIFSLRRGQSQPGPEHA